MNTRFAPSLVILTLIFFSLSRLATAEDQPSDDARLLVHEGPRRIMQRVDSSRLKDGWQLTANVPQSAVSESAVCELSVTGEWLRVQRRSDDGLEWQVVLAQVADESDLQISVVENQPAIEISYGGGRYFIRDTAHALRIVRQRKQNESPFFAPGDCLTEREARGRAYFDLPPARDARRDGKPIAGDPLIASTLSGWDADDWFFIAAGPSDEKIDCLLRLNPIERASSGYGFQSIHGGLVYAFHGEAWALDDGELMVAFRMLPDDHRLQQQIERIRDHLPSSSPPAIDAARWLNTDEELRWNDLKGKVVLLDFWATWCGPCVKKLPDVQAIHEKYKDRGLVVIGVHLAQGAEECAPLVQQHGLQFPIAIDTGATEKAFAITSVPAYFLIDADGKVVYGYSAKPPSAEMIDSLLAE